jgi:hypothetical protein
MPERGGIRSKRSLIKWGLLLAVALAGFAAFKTGWVGFGWAQVKAAVWPRDESLLAWMPPTTEAVAIVDPHQLSLKALAADHSVLGPELVRVRGDVLKATGVDLAFDVDKLALAPNLAVLRGRFDGDALESKLAEYRYVKADHSGRTYLVRAGEDAVMVEGEYLVYGDESAIKAAIDAQTGASLAKNDSFTGRLARMGWNYPLLTTVALADDRPSLRSLIAGATGPRAVTVGVRSAQGIDVRALVETGTAAAAGELAKLLEERRAGAAAAVESQAGPELAALLGSVAKEATIRADTSAGQVEIRVHVRPETLDAILRAAEKAAAWSDVYKTFRLYQLLAPAH